MNMYMHQDHQHQVEFHGVSASMKACYLLKNQYVFSPRVRHKGVEQVIALRLDDPAWLYQHRLLYGEVSRRDH